MSNNNVMALNGAFQLKGGTAAALAAANPLLAQREIAVETDTGKIKVGNGSDHWNNLPYSGASQNSNDSQNSDGFSWPNSDNLVYVIQNAAFVPTVYVHKPAVWEPSVYDIDFVFLTLDEDMTPFQLGASENSIQADSDMPIQPLQFLGDNTEVNL